jgi:phage gp36-like protein
MALQFVTKANILTRITETDLNVITGGIDSQLDEPEADAINEIGSYIAARYDVDLIFNPATDAEKDSTIKRMVIDVLLYNLHNTVNPRNIPEKRIQLRDDAISWLKKVADPRSNVKAYFLPLKDFGDKRGNDLSWGSNSKKMHKY